MVAHPQVSSESDEDFVSAASAEDAATSDDEDALAMEPPTHPVPAMQAAFEESILESTEDDQPRSIEASAETRRQKILDAAHYDDSWTTRWEQKPSAQHHPLVKLMAQIVFGMHLLQQQAAKSDEEVVKILQTHVDEVDNFLERTMDDFDLAIKDIEERIKFLKLPMAHLDVFETMLEDRKFRTQLLDGNDKIEKIIDRTTRAMNAALLDAQQGKIATKDLGRYLDTIEEGWPKEKEDLDAIYGAMRGNEQGWKQCLRDVQQKGVELKENLHQLASVISEMSRLAAAVSRRQRPHSRSGSIGASSILSSLPRSKFSGDGASVRKPSFASLDKPLPQMPDTRGGAGRTNGSKPHPVPFADRYESPRATPVSPGRATSRASTVPPRPKTANSATPRAARTVSRGDTADLAEYLKQTGPTPSRGHSNGELAEQGSIRSASATVIRRARGQSSSDQRAEHKPVTNGSAKPARAATWGDNVATALRPASRDVEQQTSSPHARAQSKDTAALSKVDPADPHKSKRDSIAGTRFARRLSVRKKHLETPAQGPLTALPTPPASNAASPDKGPSPTDSKLQPTGDSLRSQQTDARSSTQRLALFPSTEPLTPSASAGMEKGRPGVSRVESTAAPSIAGTDKKKAFSLRRMFGRAMKEKADSRQKGRGGMVYGNLV
ncbi:hypothetical protein B0A48_15148 [Cryoendolithus antarcticus]|uniref:Uncharacterized protein n=1 Tax=Cryoendolithus antarcticus TaxID=1507870 RepID=A0A1V8SI37_9PEZI|nr:hypothetical protein B0A48_15148 [Cryoendolithus antarcticus]